MFVIWEVFLFSWFLDKECLVTCDKWSITYKSLYNIHNLRLWYYRTTHCQNIHQNDQKTYSISLSLWVMFSTHNYYLFVCLFLDLKSRRYLWLLIRRDEFTWQLSETRTCIIKLYLTNFQKKKSDSLKTCCINTHLNKNPVTKLMPHICDLLYLIVPHYRNKTL